MALARMNMSAHNAACSNANARRRGLPIQLQRTADSDNVHTRKRTKRVFAVTLYVTTRAQSCTLVSMRGLPMVLMMMTTMAMTIPETVHVTVSVRM